MILGVLRQPLITVTKLTNSFWVLTIHTIAFSLFLKRNLPPNISTNLFINGKSLLTKVIAM